MYQTMDLHLLLGSHLNQSDQWERGGKDIPSHHCGWDPFLNFNQNERIPCLFDFFFTN